LVPTPLDLAPAQRKDAESGAPLFLECFGLVCVGVGQAASTRNNEPSNNNVWGLMIASYRGAGAMLDPTTWYQDCCMLNGH